MDGSKRTDTLPPEAAEVARECDYLPLALAMVGAMVCLSPTGWNDALRRLKRADLAAVKRAFPGYPYPDLVKFQQRYQMRHRKLRDEDARWGFNSAISSF